MSINLPYYTQTINVDKKTYEDNLKERRVPKLLNNLWESRYFQVAGGNRFHLLTRGGIGSSHSVANLSDVTIPFDVWSNPDGNSEIIKKVRDRGLELPPRFGPLPKSTRSVFSFFFNQPIEDCYPELYPSATLVAPASKLLERINSYSDNRVRCFEFPIILPNDVNSFLPHKRPELTDASFLLNCRDLYKVERANYVKSTWNSSGLSVSHAKGLTSDGLLVMLTFKGYSLIRAAVPVEPTKQNPSGFVIPFDLSYFHVLLRLELP